MATSQKRIVNKAHGRRPSGAARRCNLRQKAVNYAIGIYWEKI